MNKRVEPGRSVWPPLIALAILWPFGPAHSGMAFASEGKKPEVNAENGLRSARRDAIEFRNGDLLYGALESIRAEEGVGWGDPDALGPVAFRLEHVREIRLGEEHAERAQAGPGCLVRLTNQDEIVGELVSCDNDKLVLKTWYAGPLTVPRKMVQFIQPRPVTAPAIYEGPTGLAGWTIGKVNSTVADAGQWHYRNGAFYATKAASIARDLKLPDVATIEFDLAWRGSFDLAIALYTDYLQPINLISKETEPEFGGFYSLRLNNYYANIMPVTKQDPIRYLGQVPMQPSFSQKNTGHIEIRVNKSRNLIALLVDGVLVKMWIDTQEFVGQGTGLRIVHQGQGASKISHLRVSEWDGQFEEKPTNPPDSRQDLVKLRNGDKLAGLLETVRDGKMTVTVTGRNLEVPLNRVKQIELAGARAERPQIAGLVVRAFFAHGGSITFGLENFDGKGFAASSPAFGKAIFDRAAFGRIIFDPRRTAE